MPRLRSGRAGDRATTPAVGVSRYSTLNVQTNLVACLSSYPTLAWFVLDHDHGAQPSGAPAEALGDRGCLAQDLDAAAGSRRAARPLATVCDRGSGRRCRGG